MLQQSKINKMISSSPKKVQLSSNKQITSTPKLRLPFNRNKIKDQPQQQLTDRTDRTTKRIDIKGMSSSRSCRRIRHCQSVMGAHDQSIKFYMKQLNRRQEIFLNKREQLQNEHCEKVYLLQRQLKIQINKNIRLEQQFKKSKQSSKQYSLNQSSQISKNNLKKINDQEILQFFNAIRKQLDNRLNNSDVDISTIRDVKGYNNDLMLSYSKTDESLLLGDVTKHYF